MTPQREEALRLLRLARRDKAAFDGLLTVPGIDFPVACFHAQQAVEKAIKAVLCAGGVVAPRTHDLEELAAVAPEMPVTLERLRRLTPYAVEFRYNDEAVNTITVEQAREMVDVVVTWATQRTEGSPE